MNNSEFAACLEEFRSFYGDTVFTTKAVNLLWRLLEPLTKGEALEVIERVVQKYNRAPSLAQIKQEAFQLLQRAWQRHKAIRIEAMLGSQACQHCGNAGVIMALSKKDPTLEYSFGCPKCQAYEVRGLKHPPIWEERHRDSFTPVSLRPESYMAGKRIQDEAFAKERDTRGVKPMPASMDISGAIAALAKKAGMPNDKP